MSKKEIAQIVLGVYIGLTGLNPLFKHKDLAYATEQIKNENYGPNLHQVWVNYKNAIENENPLLQLVPMYHSFGREKPPSIKVNFKGLKKKDVYYMIELTPEGNLEVIWAKKEPQDKSLI